MLLKRRSAADQASGGHPRDPQAAPAAVAPATVTAPPSADGRVTCKLCRASVSLDAAGRCPLGHMVGLPPVAAEPAAPAVPPPAPAADSPVAPPPPAATAPPVAAPVSAPAATAAAPAPEPDLDDLWAGALDNAPAAAPAPAPAPMAADPFFHPFDEVLGDDDLFDDLAATPAADKPVAPVQGAHSALDEFLDFDDAPGGREGAPRPPASALDVDPDSLPTHAPAQQSTASTVHAPVDDDPAEDARRVRIHAAGVVGATLVTGLVLVGALQLAL